MLVWWFDDANKTLEQSTKQQRQKKKDREVKWEKRKSRIRLKGIKRRRRNIHKNVYEHYCHCQLPPPPGDTIFGKQELWYIQLKTWRKVWRHVAVLYRQNGTSYKCLANSEESATKWISQGWRQAKKVVATELHVEHISRAIPDLMNLTCCKWI